MLHLCISPSMFSSYNGFFEPCPFPLQAALRLGPLEIGVLLGSQGRPAAESHGEITPPEDEQVPRNWLKGVREAGYTVLGTAAARVPGFFDRLDWGGGVASSLTGSLPAMEIRHLRLLIKSVVSKGCLCACNICFF